MKLNEIKVDDIVAIAWRDSGSVDGLIWQFKDDWDCDVHNCHTVGIVAEYSKDKVVVAQSSNNDQWGRLFAIPSENIFAIHKIGDLLGDIQ